jgi:hypothetical protein
MSVGLWPSRSPGLTPLDLLLFPQLQNMVFRNSIDILPEQQGAIEGATANLALEML